jgi:RNA-binding proteins (RRM domain)
MSTNYTTEKPRRSSRGGRRRSRRGGSSNSSNSNTSSRSASDSSRSRRSSESRKPKKLTFWQKIIAFFTGGEPAPVKPERRPPSPSHAAAAEKATARVERDPREPRAPRTGMRKPELVEVTTPRLYVGNLSFDAVESDLFELFSGVGLVQNVEIVTNRQTQRSKGFGFVQMQTVDEAKRAVSELHDKEYMGRKLVVSGAKAADRPEREERPEQQQQQPEQ